MELAEQREIIRIVGIEIDSLSNGLFGLGITIATAKYDGLCIETKRIVRCELDCRAGFFRRLGILFSIGQTHCERGMCSNVVRLRVQ